MSSVPIIWDAISFRGFLGNTAQLAVGLTAALIAALIGSLIGILAGFFGGRLDALLMRSVDVLMAFPYILLALAIVAVLGPGLMNALIAVAIVNIPFFARNVRGVTLVIARSDYIAAARLSGRGTVSLLLFEVVPNLWSVIIVAFSTTVGWMILETAGLSFLGLGSQPPQSDLGSMLGEGRAALITNPHTSIIPGLMIFVIVMGINLLGRVSAMLLIRVLPKARFKGRVRSRKSGGLVTRHRQTCGPISGLPACPPNSGLTKSHARPSAMSHSVWMVASALRSSGKAGPASSDSALNHRLVGFATGRDHVRDRQLRGKGPLSPTLRCASRFARPQDRLHLSGSAEHPAPPSQCWRAAGRGYEDA